MRRIFAGGGQRNASLETYRLLLAVLLVSVLVPMLLAGIYNRPKADDYSQPYPVYVAYQETGSLLVALKTAVQETVTIYNSYSGVFFSMFLSLFAPNVFGNHLMWIPPVMSILLLVAACFRASRCLRAIGKDVPREAMDCMALWMSTVLLVFIPDANEAYYWYSGMINYTFMFTYAIFLFSGVFCAVHAKERIGAGKLILLCIGFFLLGGVNYLTACVSVVLYGYMAVYVLWKKRDKRLLIPFVLLLAGFAVAVLAPGNTLRQEAVGEKSGLMVAAGGAFLEAVRFLFSDARYWVMLLPFLPIMAVVAPKITVSFRTAIVPLSLAVLAANCFPNEYANYYIAVRHLNHAFMLTCFLLTVDLLALCTCLCRHWAANEQNRPQKTRWAWCTFACAGVLLLVLSMPDMTLSPLRLKLSLPPVVAARGLANGTLAAYAADHDALVEELCAGGAVEVNTLPYHELFGTFALSTDPDNWLNESFARYYGDEDTTIVYRP